jgi:hypothetical protein
MNSQDACLCATGLPLITDLHDVYVHFMIDTGKGMD